MGKPWENGDLYGKIMKDPPFYSWVNPLFRLGHGFYVANCKRLPEGSDSLQTGCGMQTAWSSHSLSQISGSYRWSFCECGHRNPINEALENNQRFINPKQIWQSLAN